MDEEAELTQVEDTPETVTEDISGESVEQGNNEQRQVEEVWDGSKFALKFRGREIIPESREKLINLAQLGHTYSTKLNDIQSRESALIEKAKELEQYEKVAKAFDQRPEFKQKIFEYYNSLTNGDNAEEQQQSPQVQADPKLVEQVQSLAQWKEQYEQGRADEDLRKEISELIGANSNFDWKTADEEGNTLVHDVLKKAHELGGVPLEVAFKAVAWDQMKEQAKAEALKSNAEAKLATARKGKPVSAQPSQAAKSTQPKDVRSMNYDEIARDVIKNLKK